MPTKTPSGCDGGPRPADCHCREEDRGDRAELRDELLDREIFYNLRDAEILIETVNAADYLDAPQFTSEKITQSDQPELTGADHHPGPASARSCCELHDQDQADADQCQAPSVAWLAERSAKRVRSARAEPRVPAAGSATRSAAAACCSGLSSSRSGSPLRAGCRRSRDPAAHP